MFLLLFFVLLIQFFTYWIFEPITSFLEYALELRFLPIIALIALILLFSAKNNEIKPIKAIIGNILSPTTYSNKDSSGSNIQ